MDPILDIQNLSVSFQTDDQIVRAVDNVSFQVQPGEIVGLVGESGSGKTVTGMSVLRLIPQPPGRIDSGKILFRGTDLLQLPSKQLQNIRGNEISVIFQEPMTALSPLHTVGRQLSETYLLHRPELTHSQARALSEEWLERVGIPDPAARMNDYPFQFSGGMRQRVMISMALMLEPSLIIADEPTTALDVTIQAQIFDLILRMKGRNTSILFITHDMGVIWELCDRVFVMKNAGIVESGLTEDLFTHPQQAYTRQLLDAVPRLTDSPRRRRPDVQNSRSETLPGSGTNQPDLTLISIEDLQTWFPIRRGIFAHTVGYVKAVDGVTAKIRRGQTFALVGESGSGKTTLGRSILGLDPIRRGTVTFDGTQLSELSSRARRPYRHRLQMVFQDPFSSLNPRSSVLSILTEGLVHHNLLDGSRQDVAAHWLTEVGMEPEHMDRYPHEFSGGQRQRICIARAIAMNPDFVVFDEAVSALDVTVQAQVLDLLLELQERYGLTYLFISHDLSVVKRISDYVAVMKAGRILEHGSPEKIIENPSEAYTQRLIAAVPIPGADRKRKAPA